MRTVFVSLAPHWVAERSVPSSQWPIAISGGQASFFSGAGAVELRAGVQPSHALSIRSLCLSPNPQSTDSRDRRLDCDARWFRFRPDGAIARTRCARRVAVAGFWRSSIEPELAPVNLAKAAQWGRFGQVARGTAGSELASVSPMVDGAAVCAPLRGRAGPVRPAVAMACERGFPGDRRLARRGCDQVRWQPARRDRLRCERVQRDGRVDSLSHNRADLERSSTMVLILAGRSEEAAVRTSPSRPSRRALVR